MYLQHLSLIHFKNYGDADIEFSSRINCFLGNNGAGKTNLLDAIFYLSFCKSYFHAMDSQNILHDRDFFIIQGKYNINDMTEEIYCGVKRNRRKQFRRNKKEYNNLYEHIGAIPLVMVSPGDINLIIEGSEERRKFMNFVISQFDPVYLDHVMQYNRALKQRNMLLKTFADSNTFDPERLLVWNRQLILHGKDIFEKRALFIEQLIPIFQHYYNYIAGDSEKIGLVYQSRLYEKDMQDLLEESLHKDRILQYTTAGPHKDDLLLKLGDYPIKDVGSQGQIKTFLIALKLAEYDFIKKINRMNPILLLDDIFDKLDSQRAAKIIQLVAEHHFGQIFISDTNRERMSAILSSLNTEHKIFIIDNGKITEERQ